MQTLFCVISIFGIFYLLLAKRRFDWFAVAFFSACIYFLPGYFGYTSYLTLTQWNETPISDEAYLIMILVNVAILLSTLVNDFFANGSIVDEVVETEKSNGYVVGALLFLALTGLMIMLMTTGSALFYVEKQDMMDELNRSHILFYTATMIGCTMSFEQKKWRSFIIFCFLISFDFYLGFRTSLAITFISIFTLWLSKQGSRRLLFSYWRQGGAGLVLAIFMFFYKQVAFAVKSGDLDLLKRLLFESSDIPIYRSMFINSEPFIIQEILNQVTIRHYTVGMEHLKGLMYQLILFAPQFGLETKSFNDLFQRDLFPEVDYGMANNIWAEMWSSGGWPLLFMFVALFVLLLKCFALLTETRKSAQRAFVAVMASYWAFYVHRNDISYQVVLEKRVLLVMGLTLLVVALIKQVDKSSSGVFSKR
jgi:hypothetical protein